MTTETDLLPLPETLIYGQDYYFPDQMRTYARANVAHAIAPLQAKIEALRADVEEWKDVARCASEQQDSLFREACALNELADNLRAEVYFRDSVIATHAADTREYQKRISQAEARAERLAEALRLALDSHGVMLMTDPPQDAWKVLRVEEIGRALLRDQEEGHEQ